MDYPSAVQHRGPASKVWPDVNADIGIICHSLEGYVGPALAELDDRAQQLSWHFTIAYDGTIYQHYDLTESPWHAGTHAANAEFIGIEHEGVTGEALTDAQSQASVSLVWWIAHELGWATLSRDGAGKNLWEHHEVPGASTTCPNGRIDWERYLEVPLDLAVVGLNVQTIYKGFDTATNQYVYEIRVLKP